MEVRPIDANALKLALSQSYNDPENVVDDAPTLDYEPVRHGEWIQMVDCITNRKAGYRCSECGLILRKKYDYCNCGAKMDGGKKHD